MWTNTSEELVFQGSAGHMTAKAFIAKWGSKREGQVITEDAGLRKTYYTIRIALSVGDYTFHNYGDMSSDNARLYFAHKGSAITEIKTVMDKLRVREEK